MVSTHFEYTYCLAWNNKLNEPMAPMTEDEARSIANSNGSLRGGDERSRQPLAYGRPRGRKSFSESEPGRDSALT